MDIAVIGGGASGLMASIIASRNKANVTLFESNDVLGKKILVTGNGKCNLSNTNISSDYYYVDSDEFLSNAFNRFGLDDTMSFFKSIGLLMLEKRGGIYPNSEQASAVLDSLRFECDSLVLGLRLTHI